MVNKWTITWLNKGDLHKAGQEISFFGVVNALSQAEIVSKGCYDEIRIKFDKGVDPIEPEKRPVCIQFIEQLKKLAKTQCDCFILLKGGARSSKTIMWDESNYEWEVFQSIDGSWDTWTEAEMVNSTIYAAMCAGTLYAD